MYNACNAVAKWKMEYSIYSSKTFAPLICGMIFLSFFPKIIFRVTGEKTNKQTYFIINCSIPKWINYYYYYWVIEKFCVFAICVKFSPNFLSFSFSFWSKSLWTISFLFSFGGQTMSTLREMNLQVNKWMYCTIRRKVPCEIPI